MMVFHMLSTEYGGLSFIALNAVYLLFLAFVLLQLVAFVLCYVQHLSQAACSVVVVASSASVPSLFLADLFIFFPFVNKFPCRWNPGGLFIIVFFVSCCIIRASSYQILNSFLQLVCIVIFSQSGIFYAISFVCNVTVVLHYSGYNAPFCTSYVRRNMVSFHQQRSSQDGTLR